MELDAEGDLDKTPEEIADDEDFDEVIATAAAGDFEGLGWSTEPLVADAPDDGFVASTLTDFLNFPS